MFWLYVVMVNVLRNLKIVQKPQDLRCLKLSQCLLRIDLSNNTFPNYTIWKLDVMFIFTHIVYLLLTYEDGLKSFRPNKDTRHFFKNFFQRSLFVTLHTSPSDVSISVTRPNITRRFSLQNNCSWRWVPLYLTKISVLWEQIFRWGNKKKSLGTRSGE